MQNPTDVKTVIIRDTTPRTKSMIFLLGEMNPGVGFSIITETKISTQEKIKKHFENNGMFN